LNREEGIRIESSDNNTITCNNVNSNDDHGIYLYWSDNNIITSNNANSNGDDGIYLKWSDNNIITSNNVSNNDDGISLYGSKNNIITNNNAKSNKKWNGIYLRSSHNNTITNNNASNNDVGIGLRYSNNNLIYLNNFIDNLDNVQSSESTNIWNSREPITYTYNRTTYENYTGNYWDDYVFEENDTNGDGIGDIPYSIDSDKDYYPLVVPWENYFKPPEEKIFDTGEPANPYPSIMGTHNGTIKPNQIVMVSKLCTYPCPGTGGHTEYAMIWNETKGDCAVAEWNGYIGDYHNISFNKTLTLEEGVVYNYTICTGSYPQIHHTDNLSTPAGFITCSEFIDANGKKYEDWIPAIRLE